MYATFTPEQPVGLMDFVKAARAGIKECNSAQLKSKLDARQDILLVHVRESSEHEQGHLPGARLIARGILEAAAVLHMMGFRNVISLAGGIVDWSESGMPVVNEARYV